MLISNGEITKLAEAVLHVSNLSQQHPSEVLDNVLGIFLEKEQSKLVRKSVIAELKSRQSSLPYIIY